MHLSAKLRKRLKIQIGDELEEFILCCEKPTPETYRVNTIKADIKNVVFDFQADKIPWCPTGFHTKKPLGDTIEHFQGLIYMQEAASMIPPQVLSPSGQDVVLDMCAAPGSKTTQMAALMDNSGCIIANEINPRRIKTLRFNLNRMGVVNTIVSHMDAVKLTSKIGFDKILLDAPCTNLGQLRDKPNVVATWSKAKVKRQTILQKKLINLAAKLLADDGVLVYSTCTFSPEENENVIDYVIREHNLTVEPIKGQFKSHPGITEWEGKKYSPQVADTTRIYPHDNNTGGFYIAKLKK